MLWLLLVVSAAATAVLLFEFYAQSAAARLVEARIQVDRACHEISDRYDFFVAGWKAPSPLSPDLDLKHQLAGVVAVALSRSPGIEGGVWSGGAESLAYAFPTYDGTGPKTDIPEAELPTIKSANREAAQSGQPRLMELQGSNEAIVLEACPLTGPISGATAWSMTRVSTTRGEAYSQLLLGLGVLAFTVFGSAAYLGWALIAHSQRIKILESALAANDDLANLSPIAETGEKDLDRLVNALNASAVRLRDARDKLVKSERLAVIGSMTAGVAHEIRNPMAAIRLKAENALASGTPERASAALDVILQQVGRMNRLLDDLISLSRQRALHLEPVDMHALMTEVVGLHVDVADAAGVEVRFTASLGLERPLLDRAQVWRALSNLLANAIEAAKGSAKPAVDVKVERFDDGSGGRLRVLVKDTGAGVPADRVHLIFEPFETTKASGSGLGLAIVREIANAHGGEVRLIPGQQQTTFELDVPWRRS